MKKTIREWERRLEGARENLEIHLQVSTNEAFTSDMREFARNEVSRSKKYIKLLERTIELLEGEK